MRQWPTALSTSSGSSSQVWPLTCWRRLNSTSSHCRPWRTDNDESSATVIWPTGGANVLIKMILFLQTLSFSTLSNQLSCLSLILIIYIRYWIIVMNLLKHEMFCNLYFNDTIRSSHMDYVKDKQNINFPSSVLIIKLTNGLYKSNKQLLDSFRVCSCFTDCWCFCSFII